MIDPEQLANNNGAWFELIEAFRKGRKHQKQILRGFGKDQLLESFVMAMTSDARPELLKCALVVCLQENASLFVGRETKAMERVFGLLSKMLESGSTAGITLQCHILTAITCLLCELSVATRQQRLFEGFVEVLLTMVARVNNNSDGALRATACECIHELERLYPGMFHAGVGTFFVFAQTECTFAQAAYTSLFVSVVSHAVALGQRLERWGPKKTSFLQPKPLVPFSVPLEAGSSSSASRSESPREGLGSSVSAASLFSPLENHHFDGSRDGETSRASIPESVVIEIRRALQWVENEAASLAGIGGRAILAQEMDALESLLGDQDNIGGMALSMLERRSPTLLAAAVRLRVKHGVLFFGERADDSMILARLLGAGHDTSLPVELRCEAISLLAEFGGSNLCANGGQFWKELWPGSFDVDLVASAKLQALMALLAAPDAPEAPPNLLSSLSVLQEFRSLGPAHFQSRATFAALRVVLLRLPGQEEAVYRFLLDLLVYAPQFVPSLASVLDPESAASSRLLSLFDQLLCGLEPSRLVHYLPLASLVCRVPSVDPTLLLHRLLGFLLWAYNNPDASAPSDLDARWEFGSSFLALYRAVLVSQSPVRASVWEPVCQGLFVLSGRFPDVEIRDRAHSLHRIATHLRPEVAAAMLSFDDSKPLDSSLLQTPDRAKQALPPVRVFSHPFLCWERMRVPLSDSVAPLWPWEEIQSVSEISPDDESALEAFLPHHPPRQLPPLEFGLKLRFKTRGERKKTSENDQEEDEWVPDCLIGATVSFLPHEQLRPVEEDKETLHTPLLRVGEARPILLRAHVVWPLPSPPLKGTVFFSCLSDSGSCVLQCRAPLEKLRPSLEDFFSPLPNPPSLGVARAFWSLQWRRCSLPPSGASSVLRVDCSRERMERWLRGPLAQFVILMTPEMSRLIIFLSPQYHLLVEAVVGSKSTLFRIKTDLWQLMAFVEDFLVKIPE